MLLYNKRYFWEKGLMEISPGSERIFQIGDRVIGRHKSQMYSGTILEIERKMRVRSIGGLLDLGPRDPEVYIRTDIMVEGANPKSDLYEGFGIRGPSELFIFEEEREVRMYGTPSLIEIDKEDMDKFRKLSKKVRRSLIHNKSCIPFN